MQLKQNKNIDLSIFVSFGSFFSDKLFPAFGFGAQVPPDWQVGFLL